MKKHQLFLVLAFCFAVNLQAQTITTGSVRTPVCAGSSISVPFTITGSFTAGNVFTAELSSSTGSFTIPVTIGTLNSTQNGAIVASIPSRAGTGFRIRVVGGNPVVVGSSVSITLVANPFPTISVSGPTTFCNGSSVVLTASAGSSYLWNNGATTQAITSTNADSYTVKVTNANGCQREVSEATVVTVNPNLPASVNIVADDAAYPNAKTFTANALNGGTSPVYQWYDGTTAVGTNSATYTTSSLTNGQSLAIKVEMTSNATPCLTGSPATSNVIYVKPILPSVSLVSAGIGAASSNSDPSAQLEVKSDTKGFLPPRMTATERDAIASPVAGLMLYCSNCGTNGELEVYNGATWTNLIGNVAAAVVGSATATSIISDPTNFNTKANTLVAVDKLDITPSADFSLNTGIARNTTATNALTSAAISRYYKFGATTNAFSGVLKINYDEADLNGLTESNLKLLYHNGTAWTSDANSSNNATNNFVQSSSLNAVGLNEVTAKVIVASALPVNLTSFTAKPTPDNKVSLVWNTSSESVNKGFRIERQSGSGNGKYEQIGFVGSKAKDGNSQRSLTYNFIDTAPKVGVASFYRLVQEDLDGKLTWSQVRMVKLNGQSVTLVFPNPSNGVVNINRTADGRKMNIQVTDQSGKTIIKVKNITTDNYKINFSHSGAYNIKMIFPETGEESIQRVVIQK
jgi:hypothetical protein